MNKTAIVCLVAITGVMITFGSVIIDTVCYMKQNGGKICISDIKDARAIKKIEKKYKAYMDCMQRVKKD